MGPKQPAKRKSSSNGFKYCCAINCSNNSGNEAIHPSTLDQTKVRFHTFPNPDKERERCSKWIVNLRRADLNINNIKFKVVCSSHFEPNAYNNPNDISTSRLLPTAVPTLVNCPNPPKPLTPFRPPPKKRQIIEQNTSLPSSATTTNTFPDTVSTISPTPISCDVPSHLIIRELEEKLVKSQQALKGKQKHINGLKRQVKRLQTERKKHLLKEHQLHSKLVQSRQFNVDDFIEQFPPIPSALIKVLLRRKKKVNWTKELEIMELCLSIFFRSSSAYSALRSSGFSLPHPNTLRNCFS